MKADNLPRHLSTKVVTRCLLLCAAITQAQPVVAPSNQAPTPRTDGPSKPGTKPKPSLSDFASAFPDDAPLFTRYGISVRPHPSYRILYSSGLQAGPGTPLTTYIQEASAGILFEVGTHWTLDYTPSWTFYSNDRFKDTVSHNVNLSGKIGYGDWTFGLFGGYNASTLILTETGRPTYQETYSTGGSIAYQLGPRTLLETTQSWSVRHANAPADRPDWTTADWKQWSSSNWLHYQISNRLEIAAGIGLGTALVSTGSDMSYSQPQGQVTWRVSDKLSLTANAGVEHRSFQGSGVSALNSPIYSGSLNYEPLETTTFSLGGSRNVSASYFANQAIKSEGWNAGVNQRLLQRYYLSLNFADQKTVYISTSSSFVASRRDTYRSISARLSTTLLHRGTVALIYQNGHNSSNVVGFGFSSYQAGFELGYRF